MPKSTSRIKFGKYRFMTKSQAAKSKLADQQVKRDIASKMGSRGPIIDAVRGTTKDVLGTVTTIAGMKHASNAQTANKISTDNLVQFYQKLLTDQYDQKTSSKGSLTMDEDIEDTGSINAQD